MKYLSKMNIKTIYNIITKVLFLLIVQTVSSQQWYAGQWNSEYTSNMLDAHPLTIVIRIEVFDIDTRAPIRGAEVRLEGNYKERVYRRNEYIDRGDYLKYYVDKEFRLTAYTDRDGIAVFALRWNKPEALVRSDIPDDIEKVQKISVRKINYEYYEIEFIPGNANDYLDGIDPTSFWNEWPRGGYGWETWSRNVRYMNNDARYFQLAIQDSNFNDYDNDACNHPILFGKVRDKIYDYEYPNMSNMYQNPPDRIGPFIMIPYYIGQQRIYIRYE